MKSLLLSLAVLALASTAFASNGGKVFPSEMTSYVDPVTKLKVTVLTTDASSSEKPYQTHPTWTADGQWIIMRSNRGDNGQQAFLVHQPRQRQHAKPGSGRAEHLATRDWASAG